MIIYRNYRHLGVNVLTTKDSPLLAETAHALLGSILTLIFRYTIPLWGWDLESWIRNPGPYFSGIAFVLGLLLAYRGTLAYQTYWEARTFVAQMMSKMNDLMHHAANHVVKPDAPHGKEWKRRQGKLILLFQYCVIMRLRGHFDFDFIRSKGVATDLEYELLRDEPNPALRVMTWIVDNLVSRHATVGYCVPAVVHARTYQILTDIMAQYGRARSVRETPFPFPLTQLCNFLNFIFIITLPVIIARFVPDIYYAVAISFVISWAFGATNSMAERVENPYGELAIDFPMNHWMAEVENDLYAIGVLKEGDLTIEGYEDDPEYLRLVALSEANAHSKEAIQVAQAYAHMHPDTQQAQAQAQEQTKAQAHAQQEQVNAENQAQAQAQAVKSSDANVGVDVHANGDEESGDVAPTHPHLPPVLKNRTHKKVIHVVPRGACLNISAIQGPEGEGNFEGGVYYID